MIIVSMALLASCSKPSTELALDLEGLMITAQVENALSPFAGDKYKISATVEVKNNSKESKNFSNKKLMAIVKNEAPARAYNNAYYASALDSTGVEVPVGEGLDLQLYWIIGSDQYFDISTLTLEYQSSP
ncbi:MAG: hypothetical protein HN790_17415 [Methylococcales bacterium]|nr:hypothetical protein [Methylococcales bacterium]